MFVRRILGMVVALVPVGVSIGTVEAAGLNFSLDVPAVFGGTWYSPSQTVRWTGSAFTSDPSGPASLGPDVNLTGLTWSFQEAGLLFSVDASFTAPSGLKFNPGDVIEYKGGNYSMFLLASTIGLPPGAASVETMGSRCTSRPAANSGSTTSRSPDRVVSDFLPVATAAPEIFAGGWKRSQ